MYKVDWLLLCVSLAVFVGKVKAQRRQRQRQSLRRLITRP